MQFQCERWRDIEPEIICLMPLHWQELALDQDNIALDIDFLSYRRLDEQHDLVVITARNEGKLLGYYIGMVRPHLHYKSTVFGICDAYWLHPSERRGTTGIEFFHYVENVLKGRGAKSMITTSKKHLNIAPLFAHLGHREVGTIYQKWIGD